ncbi:hypothetical protein Tco_0079155 [Tanacetum coccineum]
MFPPLTGCDRLVSRAKDPYEAIRQAYLDGMDIESETFKDPVETKTPESPLTVAPPTSLHKCTSSTLVPILRRTTWIVVRVPPVMSPGLSASMEEVAAMYESAFCKRFRSSYESSPSSSLPDLPLRKRYRGTSELVEDDEDNDDEEEEDEEIEESLDFESMSEDAKDEGPTAEDEDPAAWDESLAAGDEAPIWEGGGGGYTGESAAGSPVMRTTVSAPLGLGYGALRRRELALEEDHVYNMLEVGLGLEDGIVYIDVPVYPPLALPAQTPPSPEWSSGSFPISPSHCIVPLPISSPVIPLTIPSPVPTPAMAEIEGFLTELGAQVEM